MRHLTKSRRRSQAGHAMIELTAAIMLLLATGFYMFNATFVGVSQVSKALRGQLADIYLNNDMAMARRYSEVDLNLLWPANGSTAQTDNVSLTDPPQVGFTATIFRTRTALTQANPGGTTQPVNAYTYTTVVQYQIAAIVYQKTRQTVRYIQ